MIRTYLATVVALGTSIIVAQTGCTPSALSTTASSHDSPQIAAIGVENSPRLAAPKDSPTEASRQVKTAKELYRPVPSDFRAAYEMDENNSSRQTWDDYYSWVIKFYGGNLFDSGWTKRAVEVLEGVQSEQVRDELRASLNELSQMIAAEWSKDNAVRKISTSDLSAFGSRLLLAKSKDDGTGANIRKEITAIWADVEAKLRR